MSSPPLPSQLGETSHKRGQKTETMHSSSVQSSNSIHPNPMLTSDQRISRFFPFQLPSVENLSSHVPISSIFSSFSNSSTVQFPSSFAEFSLPPPPPPPPALFCPLAPHSFSSMLRTHQNPPGSRESATTLASSPHGIQTLTSPFEYLSGAITSTGASNLISSTYNSCAPQNRAVVRTRVSDPSVQASQTLKLLNNLGSEIPHPLAKPFLNWLGDLAQYQQSNEPSSIKMLPSSPFDTGILSRRKNASRECTSMLRTWLHEHFQHPYPTKAEKIMLSLITKMTLTQVSTWFANARRRLKKEGRTQQTKTTTSSSKLDDDDDDDSEDELEEDLIPADNEDPSADSKPLFTHSFSSDIHSTSPLYPQITQEPLVKTSTKERGKIWSPVDYSMNNVCNLQLVSSDGSAFTNSLSSTDWSGFFKETFNTLSKVGGFPEKGADAFV